MMPVIPQKFPLLSVPNLMGEYTFLTQHPHDFMPQVISVASAACVASTFVQLQCGDGDTLVTTASLSTRMRTWKGWGAWMLPVCWHFSLSNTGVSHIHARSWGGLIQLEIRQMKTLECGWYDLLTVPITLLIFPSFILIQFTALPTLFLSMELDLFPRTLNTIRLMTFSTSSMLISMQIITPLRSRPDFITYCTYFS